MTVYREGQVTEIDRCHQCQELADQRCSACGQPVCREHQDDVLDILEQTETLLPPGLRGKPRCARCVRRLRAIVSVMRRTEAPWWHHLPVTALMLALMAGAGALASWQWERNLVASLAALAGAVVIPVVTALRLGARHRRRRGEQLSATVQRFLGGEWSGQELPDPADVEFVSWCHKQLTRRLGLELGERRTRTIIVVAGGALVVAGVAAGLGLLWWFAALADDRQLLADPGELTLLQLGHGRRGRPLLAAACEVELDPRPVVRDRHVTGHRVDVIDALTGRRLVRRRYPDGTSFDTRPTLAPAARGLAWAVYDKTQIQLLRLPSLDVHRSWEQITATHGKLRGFGVSHWAVDPASGVLQVDLGRGQRQRVHIDPRRVERELDRSEKRRFRHRLRGPPLAERGYLVPGKRISTPTRDDIVASKHPRRFGAALSRWIRGARGAGARRWVSEPLVGRVTHLAVVKGLVIAAVDAPDEARDFLIALGLKDGKRRWRREL